MRVTVTGIEGAGSAAGTAVVIDVIRAFTTAAHALAAGAGRIVCVAGLDEARSLRHSHYPGAPLMGEERGLRPEGFDFGNETGQFEPCDLGGAAMVQRTSNGTRGLAAARGAAALLAAAAVTVTATARWLEVHGDGRDLTLVTTGHTSEDRAVAEHLAALVGGAHPDPQALRAAVLAAAHEHLALWTRPRTAPERQAFLDDIDRCAEVDRFDFAMVAERDAAGRPVLGKLCV